MRDSQDTSRKRETLRSRRAPGLRSYLLFYQIQCDSRHQTNTLLHAKPAETEENMRGMNGARNARTAAGKAQSKSGDKSHCFLSPAVLGFGSTPHCRGEHTEPAGGGRAMTSQWSLVPESNKELRREAVFWPRAAVVSGAPHSASLPMG